MIEPLLKVNMPEARERIPEAYYQGHCYTDFWGVYQLIIPDERHTRSAKEDGHAAHVEYRNNTLRQRFGRFVGRILSLSKRDRMHELCLRLFLHGCNILLAHSFG